MGHGGGGRGWKKKKRGKKKRQLSSRNKLLLGGEREQIKGVGGKKGEESPRREIEERIVNKGISF